MVIILFQSSPGFEAGRYMTTAIATKILIVVPILARF